jgi:2-octaprenyl-6-methoxyphenol hydroxylase
MTAITIFIKDAPSLFCGVCRSIRNTKFHKQRKAMAKILEADIIIVGGGPAGCSMAALLAANDVSVICIDQDDPKTTLKGDFDGRTTAISYGSRRVIEAAGAWESLKTEACAIDDIQIIESGSAVLLEFLIKDVENKSFGWIVENCKLRAALYSRLKSLKNAQHIAPARVSDFSRDDNAVTVQLQDGRVARAKLVVGADGRKSFTREWMGIGTRGWTYRQRGVVCIVNHERPHNNVAVEDFRENGPFAILPMSDDIKGNHRSSIVWTEHGPEKQSALYWDENSFNAALCERFPAFYGKVSLSGRRFSYPLTLTHAHSYIAPRMVLVADAAHAIHPIAGQGLNLGLRDVAELASLIVEAKKSGKDIGSDDLLQTYERARRPDNMLMAAATDSLNRLFSNDVAPMRLLRRLGLRMVQAAPETRKFFMKQAMGTSGRLPRLIKDGKL